MMLSKRSLAARCCLQRLWVGEAGDGLVAQGGRAQGQHQRCFLASDPIGYSTVPVWPPAARSGRPKGRPCPSARRPVPLVETAGKEQKDEDPPAKMDAFCTVDRPAVRDLPDIARLLYTGPLSRLKQGVHSLISRVPVKKFDHSPLGRVNVAG